MTAEKIKELTVIKDTSKITSKQVLFWPKRIEVPWSQKTMLKSLQETKYFDMIIIVKWRQEQKQISIKWHTTSKTNHNKM